MPLFIGAAGLSVDTVLWALWKREIQRAADSAAIAGALTVQQARYKAEAAAKHDFKKSKAFEVGKAQMWFENSPNSGAWTKDDNAVLVRVRMNTSLPFSNFFLQKPVFIEAEAVATLAKGTESCVLALDKSANAALSFGGDGYVNLDCSASSNSGSTQSVVAEGSSSVNAPHIYAVGDIPRSSNFGSSELQRFSPPQIDPFSNLPSPNPPSVCAPKVIVEPGRSATISPGCYMGLELKGYVTLLPGTYYVAGGNVYVSSNAQVTATGVTLILTKGSVQADGSQLPSYSSLTIEGGAALDMSAPTAGDYKNVLIYQDRAAPSGDGKTNTISGNSSAKISGGIYFPSQPILFTGNTGMTLGCFKLVARKVRVTGSADFRNNCAEGDDRFRRERVRLVS